MYIKNVVFKKEYGLFLDVEKQHMGKALGYNMKELVSLPSPVTLFHVSIFASFLMFCTEMSKHI